MAHLKSDLFSGNARLDACAVSDPAHVLLGDRGEHVRLIQHALFVLDGASIEAAEVQSSTYGPSTAAAVLAYKSRRQIIAKNRQTTADDVVGKMTIASLDEEMLKVEARPSTAPSAKHIRPTLGRLV